MNGELLYIGLHILSAGNGFLSELLGRCSCLPIVGDCYRRPFFLSLCRFVGSFRPVCRFRRVFLIGCHLFQGGFGVIFVFIGYPYPFV